MNIASGVRKIAALTLCLIFTALLTTTIFGTDVASAQSSVVCDGLDASGGFCSDDTTSPTVDSIIASALNILSVVAGVAAVIMFMLGGAKYITSQGDSGSVNSAKNTLLYAVIGLVIVVSAQTIVFFFLNNASTL